MDETSFNPNDVMQILKKRKAAYILPFLAVTAIAVIAALLWPPVYRSQSTILIEQREIPAEFVTSSITTFAEQRMQNIHARILTSTRLLELIEQFDLYAELKGKKTKDEIIEKMKDDIHLKPVNVEITDRRLGITATATIAFTLSYDGKNPKKVQQVASTITSLFLKEDIKVRKEQSSSAYDFLFAETQRVKDEMMALERKIAVFKEANVESLPELFQLNQQTLTKVEHDIEYRKETLRALREKKEELEEELNNTAMYMEETELQREMKHQDEQRLEMLEMELISLKTKYSDLYPDVKKLQQEIKELSAKVEVSRTEEKEKSKNPAYITLSSRLAGLTSDILSTKNQIEDMETQADEIRLRLAMTPKVEEKYNAMVAEKQALYRKSADLQTKMMEAKVAREFESKQKGERFSLVEAARLPEKPYKPNRIAIVIIGMVLGIGAGVGLTALLEFSDTSVRKAQTLSQLTNFPVLSEIPPIVTQEDRKRIRRKWVLLILSGIALAALTVFLFHTFVMDLNVLFAKIDRKFF